MARLADPENIRFRYEVAGHSIQEIASDLRINLEALTHLVRTKGWTKGEPPGVESTEEQVDEYYKRGRMHLTSNLTRRALRMYPKIAGIEDNVIEALDNLTSEFDATDPNASKTLSLIMTSYTKLMDKQQLLHEAIATPALADKKLEKMLQSSDLSSLLDRIDGNGRKLPGDDEDDI